MMTGFLFLGELFKIRKQCKIEAFSLVDPTVSTDIVILQLLCRNSKKHVA